ncbi:MAG: ABC transporter ATP-binding protein [Akkermansiaceae bacterium]|jgi:putative ABC transport system ATP-binding protein|nr:ABC transporter ATP-binding protein [Akkermansiaceae bacterium]
MNAVHCQQIEKSFGSGETEVKVLRGVDFTAHQGEMTFLVGPSGCGKTTLISIIAGLLGSDSGSVELFGESIASLSSREQILFRRRHLGFVFQQYNLLPSLTAAENAAVPLFAAGMNRKAAVAKAADLLDRLGIGHRAHALPRLLSGGQQQRVALARALVHEPRLIICDEPTAALDHKSGESVMELLSNSAVHPDRAVIVVTHDNRVFHFAHRIAHMDDGVITHTESSAPTAATH